jgi:hypothetical protein
MIQNRRQENKKDEAMTGRACPGARLDAFGRNGRNAFSYFKMEIFCPKS